MQINVTEIEPCKLLVQYHADPDQISTKKVEVLNAFKKAPVPGFRSGKASTDAIKFHYRSQMEDALKRALAEEAFHNTLFEKNIKPHGGPMFTALYLMDGKFSCEFNLHTKPSFELANYKNLEIPKPHEPENAVEVCEKMLQELRVRYGEVTPYTDADFVQTGDNIILNYDGFVDGEKNSNLCAEGEMVTVGKNALEEFDTNLLGMKAGETREFSIKVPEHGLPSMAGKVVAFKAMVVTGSKTTPCPLDDTLAVKLNRKTYAELREAVLASAQSQVANKFKLSLNEAVSKRLVHDNAFEIPSWMVLPEAKYLAHSAKLNWDSLPDADRARYIQLAQNNVKLSLILEKIRESEPDAQLTDQEVVEIIKRNLSLSNAKVSFEEMMQEMNKTGYLQVLLGRIKDEHVLDFVVKHVRVVE